LIPACVISPVFVVMMVAKEGEGLGTMDLEDAGFGGEGAEDGLEGLEGAEDK